MELLRSAGVVLAVFDDGLGVIVVFGGGLLPVRSFEPCANSAEKLRPANINIKRSLLIRMIANLGQTICDKSSESETEKHVSVTRRNLTLKEL